MATKQNIPATLDYSEARSRLIEDAAAVEVHGVPLKTAGTDATGTGFWDTHFPILWCFCVQDTPDNPCPCTGPIVWLPRDEVFRTAKASHRSEEGRAVSTFWVSRGAQVIVDKVERVPVERFLARRQAEPCGCGTEAAQELLLPAPQRTTEETGICWYSIRLDEAARTAVIVGYDESGDEIGRHVTRQTGEDEAKFEVSQGRLRLQGEIALSRRRDGSIRTSGRIDDQPFEIFASPGTTCHPPDDVVLGAAKLQLLGEWGRITEPLLKLSTGADAGKAKKSCFGCIVLLAGVSVGAGCCVAGNPACCAATGVGGSTFIDDCKGACA